MSETISLYLALQGLDFDPATLGVAVKQQKGYDYGSPDSRFYPVGEATVTFLSPSVAQPMLYKPGLQTFADLGLTGNEPMIQIILTMIEAAKAAQSTLQATPPQ